jgi:adenylate cyclase
MKKFWKSIRDDHSSGTRRRALFAALGGGLAALLMLFGAGPAEHARSGFSDWIVRLSPKPRPPVSFGLLLIDSSSMETDQIPPEEIAASAPLRMMAAGYPWDRTVYAEAMRRVLDAGARLVILDVLLLGSRDGDDAMWRVLEEYPGRIVIVSNFVEDLSGDGHTIVRYQLPMEGELPAGTSVGFANFWRDPDGLVRSAPFRMVRPGGEIVHSSPATALGLLRGEAARDALPDTGLFIPCIEGFAPDLRVPIWQVFSDSMWEANLAGGTVFKDRVLAIGASAPQFHDEFATPVGQIVGAGLHLGALGAAMEGAFYREHRRIGGVLGGLLGAAVVFGIWLGLSRFAWKVAACALAAGAAIALSVAILNIFGWMPPTFGLLFGGSFGGVAMLVSDLLTEGRERLRARRILERYVSPEVAREILDHRSTFLESLGGTSREVTILFSDLRGFTASSEHGDPSTVFDELNEYFGHMVDEILASGGWVDKFMGDGILAVWGVLPRRTVREEAAAAVGCAAAMVRALDKLNIERERRGLVRWRIGIGIHTGHVLFGNLGTHAKMEPTVIGDTVNLASRIEGYTKALRLDTLLSGSTAEETGQAATLRPADRARLVGRSKPVDLFTFWPESFEDSARQTHRDAIEHFRAGRFREAEELFLRILAGHSGDGLAEIYRDRCAGFLAHPPPEGWDGVSSASSK